MALLFPEKFKVYLVGGAVRDEILGRNSKDRDYLITGATPEELIRMGFRQDEIP